MKVTVSPCILVFVIFGLHEAFSQCAVKANRCIVDSTEPFQVNVYRKNATDGQHHKICEGTLVSFDVIISAAHCFYNETLGRVENSSEFMVSVGEHKTQQNNVQKYSVKRINVPGKYSGESGRYKNDIALVHVPKPFNRTKSVSPIQVNWIEVFEFEEYQLREKMNGWVENETGKLGPKLEKIDYETNGNCSAMIKTHFRGSLPDDKFCEDFGTRSSRRSDVGGLGLYGCPISSDGATVLGGVISLTPDDAVYITHAVFTNVSHHLNWIRYFFSDARDPDVEQIECTLPEEPRNGSYEVRSCSGECGHEPGTKVPEGQVLHYVIKCEEGYILDKLTSTCENRRWTETPRCIKPGHITGGTTVRVNVNQPANLLCILEGDPVSDFSWMKIEDSNNVTLGKGNRTKLGMSLTLASVSRDQNGTYECRVKDYNGTINARTFLVVTEKPTVRISNATAHGAHGIYLRWTVDDGNDPVTALSIQHKEASDQWTDNPEKINVDGSSYVVEGLEKHTTYDFKITATNTVGDSEPAFADAITSGAARIMWISLGQWILTIVLSFQRFCNK